MTVLAHEWELVTVGLSWAWVCPCGAEAADFGSDLEAVDHATAHEVGT